MRKSKEAIIKTGIVLRYLFKSPKLVRRIMSFLYKGYFLEVGWINSFLDRRPVDENNQPLPWFTYPIIEFLNERLSNEMTLFEYGGGNSTLYLSRLVKNVTTVEHNEEWFKHLQSNCPDNCTLIYRELEYGGAYATTSQDSKKVYNIIIVDGRDRVNCAQQAIDALSENGVIIFDDFERERYQNASVFLDEHGFKQLNFWGFKPGFFDRSNTALFYRSDNVFRL